MACYAAYDAPITPFTLRHDIYHAILMLIFANSHASEREHTMLALMLAFAATIGSCRLP